MTRIASVIVLVLFAATEAASGSVGPMLANGVVSYIAQDGKRKEIQVGKRCGDLWVSPDESVIAFIGIEKVDPKTAYDEEPFIWQSSVYVARKSDGFKPVHLAYQPVPLDGRRWRVVRRPSVSPDLRTVYFSVPYTMTSWKLVSTPFPNGPYKVADDESAYCVIWGGAHSGEVLMLSRVPDAATATYRYFVRDRSGARQAMPDDAGSSGFDEFADRWSREHGGTCHQGQ
jgi:hypothetical protein